MAKADIPDIIIERAVELWCRALRRPDHDNGDRSFAGVLGAAIGNTVAERQIAAIPDYAAAIEVFRAALVERLKYKRDHEGEPTGEQNSNGSPRMHWLSCSLNTDYHPDDDLAFAADKAGIPHSAFSIKSRVSFYDASHVSAAFGDAAVPLCHFPLPDGRWVITRLSGDDMPLILQAVQDGRLPELTVEAAA